MPKWTRRRALGFPRTDRSSFGFGITFGGPAPGHHKGVGDLIDF